MSVTPLKGEFFLEETACCFNRGKRGEEVDTMCGGNMHPEGLGNKE